MKKLILAFVAVMTMTAAQAQGDNNQGNGERPRVDRTEMLKRRTDDAVKKYGLNEEQAAKLLQLNTKYADTMGRRMGGQRGGRRGGARPAPNFGGGDNGGGKGQRQSFLKHFHDVPPNIKKPAAKGVAVLCRGL